MRTFITCVLCVCFLSVNATDIDVNAFLRRVRTFGHTTIQPRTFFTRRPHTTASSPVDIKPTVTADTTQCFDQPNCPPVFYHNFVSVDGTCNNRVDKNKGRANRSYKRLIQADYSDKRGSPRKGRQNQKLPSTRLVSTVMSNSVTHESSVASHLVPLWGQYIAHDIAHTPVIKTDINGDSLECNCDNPATVGCFNIQIPEDDVQNEEEGKTCFPLKRSQPVADSDDCDTSIRQQFSDISAYIDLGTIYGSSQSHLNSLMDPNSDIGLLREFDVRYHGRGGLDLLPVQSEINSSIAETMQCPIIHKPRDLPCFVSGDVRVNENSALITQHTLWMKQHNRIARELASINPSWKGSLIFQTTRAIVTALEQIVTYDHFLPTIIGRKHMHRFGLNLVRKGYWYGYDSTYDATVSNAFTAAAFRFGHSMIRSTLSRPQASWRNSRNSELTLKDSFFNSEPLMHVEGAGSIVRGFLKDKAQKVDSSFVDDLRNFLFAEPGKYGLDLLAINIQRGRDHGIPSYNKYREFCGLKVAESFGDFVDMPEENRKKLASLYRHVDDVDLYIAGVSEYPVEDGSVGPTFACIISYQFRDIRKGDRFWHENGGIFEYFTRDQLNALRSASFSRLICDVMPDMETIQPHPMRVDGFGNYKRPCQNFQALDLRPWQENGPSPRSSQRSSFENPDTEWTSWFPASTRDGHVMTASITLNHVMRYRPDEVCHQVLDTQTTKINDETLVRFQCSPGTIKHTDYPPVNSNDAYWSKWSDSSTPDRSDGDDVELRLPRQSDCFKPLAIQVQTLDGIPARETEEVFEEFSVHFGFICRAKQQRSGKCSDYRVRYLCRRGQAQNTDSGWTNWISTDTMDNRGDLEYLANARGTPGLCRRPVDIEVRTVEGKIPASETGDIIRRMRPDYGFTCFNSEQPKGRCHDYEVRYLCPGTSNSLPFDVQRQKSFLCRSYRVCC
ncbi:salivary peroxidase/catechol oxidase-like [Clavelina lepadiformis]|uniref:WxxW domain-containing protein n=1 Tax=Clavelina lepadiformis TaxID=159417 RepID=A0ABP0FZL0_CLALP